MALDYNIIGERLKEARVNKKYTQENLDEEIKELCKNYPQYRFMLYYKIMTTLQQIGNNDLLEKYYQEINTCIPMNEEQKDLLEVIKEIFG